MLALEVGQKSHVGRSRKINQDSFAALDSSQLSGAADGLFVVADGMGGRAGGEVASQVTVQTVCKVVREVISDNLTDTSSDLLSRAISEAVSAANLAVWNQSRANPELRGMGTTCVSALVRNDIAAVCNVGDSRMYLLRHGEMVQLTSDHSLVHEYVMAGDLSPEQARSSRYKNVITRAIGIANEVNPDVELVDLSDGDTLLLCSDGLTNMLTDTEIARILAASATADSACTGLVDAANSNGGIDNITTVVIRCGRFVPSQFVSPSVPVTAPAERPASVPTRRAPNRAGVALTLIALILLGTAGGVYYANGGWPTVSIKWKQEPLKTPPPKPAPKRLDYDTPQFVSTKPLLGYPLACDGTGALIARTTGGKLIRISDKGKVLSIYGTASPPLEMPSNVHIKADSAGNLYVSLRKEKVIYKYDLSGKRVAEIGSKSLLEPEDIAIDQAGNVYVIDSGRLKVCAAHESVADGRAAGPEASTNTIGSNVGASHGP